LGDDFSGEGFWVRIFAGGMIFIEGIAIEGIMIEEIARRGNGVGGC
jgi:hypothetical protein